MSLLSLNVFKWCRFLRHTGRVMILVVYSLEGLSVVAVYKAYIPHVLPFGPQTIPILLLFLLFTSLAALSLISYTRCVLTDPGGVPDGWHPFDSQEEAALALERLMQAPDYFGRDDPKRPRYCRRCKRWKPPRAHHCSVGRRCVLRYDHWCVWVLNTVGLLNYKYFILFVFYTCVAACVGSVALLIPAISLLADESMKQENSVFLPIVFFAFIIDVTFALCLGAFLLMHIQLLAQNSTTVETYDKAKFRPWPFDRGWKQNVKEVMGDSPRWWFVPHVTQWEVARLLEASLNLINLQEVQVQMT